MNARPCLFPGPERRSTVFGPAETGELSGDVDFQSGIDISVVVPTYKGAASLRELVERAEALFDERGLCGEIVLVNDASPDSTWSVIGELTRDHAGVVGVDLLTNHGQARATLCGIGSRADVSSRRWTTICSTGPRISGCCMTLW